MTKYIRIFVISIASIAILGVATWCVIGWVVAGAFKSAAQDGGLRKLFDVAEASVGTTLARGDVQLQPGKAAGEGGLTFYQQNPQALQSDKKYFETWSFALAIAHAGLNRDYQMSRWESSTTAQWITPADKTDSWGHAFCVESGQQQTIVVSPGPHALSSLDCSTLSVSEEELAKMFQGRLNPHRSGVMILFLKRKHAARTP